MNNEDMSALERENLRLTREVAALKLQFEGLRQFFEAASRLALLVAGERGRQGRDYIRSLTFGKQLDDLDAAATNMYTVDLAGRSLELLGTSPGDVPTFEFVHQEGSVTIASAQLRVAAWVATTLGANCLNNSKERALRLLEEALELAQALGIDPAVARRVVDYVYGRPVGEVSQELAGCAVTLLAASAATRTDLSAALVTEMERVERPEIRAKVAAKQAQKREALVTDEDGNGL